MKYFVLAAIFTIPTFVFAQGYTPLVGVPGLDANNLSIDKYINTLYALSISIAALLAVIKIIIAGVKWMMSDIVTNKMEAKKDITGALLGLLIVLGAVLIITVINPDILDVDLQFKKVATPVPSSAATPAGSQAPLPFGTSAGATPGSIVIGSLGPGACGTAGGTYVSDNGSGSPACTIPAPAQGGSPTAGGSPSGSTPTQGGSNDSGSSLSERTLQIPL